MGKGSNGRGAVVDPRLLERLNRTVSRVVVPTYIPTGEGPPPVPDHWHPVAVSLYERALDCKHVEMFEAGDWAVVVVLGESVTNELSSGATPRTGTMTAWSQVLKDLDAEVVRRRDDPEWRERLEKSRAKAKKAAKKKEKKKAAEAAKKPEKTKKYKESRRSIRGSY